MAPQRSLRYCRVVFDGFNQPVDLDGGDEAWQSARKNGL